jgi:hypothetical protein
MPSKAKRARKAETPKQPSLNLRLRALYFYPDPPITPGLEQSANRGWSAYIKWRDDLLRAYTGTLEGQGYCVGIPQRLIHGDGRIK